jgi:hypothetical protein
MATTPNFTATPRIGLGQVTAANTARDGTGTIATIFTAGANGSRIDWIEITATGTTTTNVVRLFLNDGTNNRLLDEVLVTAITPSTSTEVFRQQIVYNNPLVLPTGWSLRASTNNAETYNIFAFGGDF